MTTLADDYADFVWPYGPMCFLPAAFETDAVPPETLRYLKEHGLPRYTPIWVGFKALESGLQKQEELSEKEGRDLFLIGRDSPSRVGFTENSSGEIVEIPSHGVVCIDSEGKVYCYEHNEDPDFVLGPDLIASGVEHFYARLVLYTQEFACFEPDKAATIRNAPKSAEGRDPLYFYGEQVLERLRAIDPAATIYEDEEQGMFWAVPLDEEIRNIGYWRSISPEEW